MNPAMTESTRAEACRSCGALTLEPILDLGPQPDPDRLLDPAGSDTAPEAPVELAICPTCGLVQLVGPRPEGPRPAHGHAMPAADDDPWVALLAHSMPAPHRLVVDVDGSSGIPADAIAGGGPVVEGLAPDQGGRAGLLLVGHALAHADDFDGLVARIAMTLAPGGIVAIDFHHALGLAQGQFDVIAHTHRSYLSLHSLEWSLDRHGLGVLASQRSDDYGGTVRVLVARRADGVTVNVGDSSVDELREAERVARIDLPVGFQGLEDSVRVACADLVAFLEDARRGGRTVAGYGAAARGTTLLNLAGVGADRLPFIVDRAPSRQMRLLPRARIPIRPPSELERRRPDDILILPWPLAGEITRELASVRGWGARFAVAMPRMKILP